MNYDDISVRTASSVSESVPTSGSVEGEVNLPSIPRRPDSVKHTYSSELRDLASAAEVVRRRNLANSFLHVGTIWFSWILVGLFLAAAFSSRLSVAVISAAVLVVLGGIVTIVWNWRLRPTAYGAACQLDAAGGLQDRISTALHFAAVEEPDGMVLCQRRDAFERLAQVDTRALFPIRIPAAAGRTLVLALAVAGLFAYRMHYRAPMMALVRMAARAHLEQAILSPFLHAKELLKRMTTEGLVDALKGEKQPMDLAEEQRIGDFSPGAQKNGAAQDASGLPDALQEDSGQQLQDQSASPGESGQAGSPSGDSPQAAAGQQSPESSNNNDGSKNDANQSGDNQSDSDSVHESLAQKMMQSLRNLVNDAMGRQPSQSSPGQPAQDAQSPSTQGGSPENDSPSQASQPNGSSADGPRMDPRGGSAAAQDGSKNAGSGSGDESNGSRPGAQQAGQNQSLPVGNMLQDRVALDTTGFRAQSRERTSAGPGTAQVPLRDISPRPVAAIKGAEQENIPLRYRLYVKRYFEHTSKAER
jgi:hypothetical protein